MKYDEFKSLTYLGKLKNACSRDIPSSRFGVGFECLDRDMWEPKQVWGAIDDPVLVDPINQDVYAVSGDRDKRTCGEKWMQPDPETEGLRHYKPLPVSTEPILLTDRSIIKILRK